MSESSVRFKGVNGDLLLSLDWAEPLDVLLDQLETQLKSSEGFFAGSRVILELSPRALTLAELQTFQELLTRYDMVLHSLRGALPDERLPAPEPAIAARPPVAPRAAAPESEPAAGLEMEDASEVDYRSIARGRAASRVARLNARTPSGDSRGQARTLLIKRTLRSGQVLNYAGSIIVVGDVNPGAEVIAGHDIVVWGSLRGTACAGVAGDPQSSIYALHMAPSQLRIADHITRSPRESLLASENHEPQPEVARIENDTIVVESWPAKKGPAATVLSKVSGSDASEKHSKE